MTSVCLLSLRMASDASTSWPHARLAIARYAPAVEAGVDNTGTTFATRRSGIGDGRAVLSDQSATIHCATTYPAPNDRHPPHWLSSVSNSTHSKPVVIQSARLVSDAVNVAADSGVTALRSSTAGQAYDPTGHRKVEKSLGSTAALRFEAARAPIRDVKDGLCRLAVSTVLG